MCLFLWIMLSHQRDKFSARSARDVNVVRNPFTSQERSLREERRGNNSVEERKGQWWKERVRKWIFSPFLNIILQFTLCFFCRVWVFFSICQLWLDQAPWGSRRLLRRGPQAAHTDSIFIQHCNNMRQKGEAAALLQSSANAELIMGGGIKKEKKTDCITVLGGRLWRVTHHRKPASLHEQGRAPAVSFGNICCRSQLQVSQGASLQDDLRTSVSSQRKPSVTIKKKVVCLKVLREYRHLRYAQPNHLPVFEMLIRFINLRSVWFTKELEVK